MSFKIIVKQALIKELKNTQLPMQKEEFPYSLVSSYYTISINMKSLYTRLSVNSASSLTIREILARNFFLEILNFK